MPPVRCRSGRRWRCRRGRRRRETLRESDDHCGLMAWPSRKPPSGLISPVAGSSRAGRVGPTLRIERSVLNRSVTKAIQRPSGDQAGWRSPVDVRSQRLEGLGLPGRRGRGRRCPAGSGRKRRSCGRRATRSGRISPSSGKRISSPTRLPSASMKAGAGLPALTAPNTKRHPGRSRTRPS